jgi:DNA-binding HxlR family transcriptional regulator
MPKKRQKANLFDPNCSSRDVLDLVGSKWSMLLLCALYDNKTRTGQLKRKVQGISQKMLTQTLREMQQNGIVKRISYPEVPPRVEYDLTELGHSLAELVVKMEQWIVKHYSIILKAREKGLTAKSGGSTYRIKA